MTSGAFQFSNTPLVIQEIRVQNSLKLANIGEPVISGSEHYYTPSVETNPNRTFDKLVYVSESPAKNTR